MSGRLAGILVAAIVLIALGVFGRLTRPAVPTIVHNARIQLAATMLNMIGVGAIGAGIITPLVAGAAGGAGHIVAWMSFGASLILLAQALAGEIAMTLGDYWLIVPLVGIALSAVGWLALWLTRNRGQGGSLSSSAGSSDRGRSAA